MDEHIRLPPPLADLREERVDLLLLADVAWQHRHALVPGERHDELLDVLAQPLGRVAERELGALALERGRDAPGDAALVAHAHHDRLLAVEQTHASPPRRAALAHDGP